MNPLFSPGVDTAAVYLEFATLYLVAYPESQEKLAREIDSVLGTTPPTLADRERMPYTMAFLSETSRFATENCPEVRTGFGTMPLHLIIAE